MVFRQTYEKMAVSQKSYLDISMESEEMEPQINAPRVTLLEGVYTYCFANTWARSRDLIFKLR